MENPCSTDQTGGHFEPLSMEDAQFLIWEEPNTPMHIGALMLLDRGKLGTPGGGVDIEKFRQGVEGVLHQVPRFRQRLRWIPVAGHPVWVDDPHVDIRYHVRHTSLPQPGTMEQLKAMVGRVMSQRLDRSKPLWEYWVIEGLDDDRFAVFSKVHHCMMDGGAGSDLAHVIMGIDDSWSPPEVQPWQPRPEPSNLELMRNALSRRARQPLDIAGDLWNFVRRTDDLSGELVRRGKAIGELVSAQMGNEPSPLYGELSPHRLADWAVMPLEEMKAVRRVAGGSLNDVALAMVTGAFRRFFIDRGLDPARAPVTSSVPVNIRASDDPELGNHVSTWLVDLPIEEPDARRRLEKVMETTARMKATDQALAARLMMRMIEFGPTSMLSLALRAQDGVADTFVTNIPGPQFPLFLFGAEMKAMMPQVPLLPGMALGIGVMSYDGKVCWGLTADSKLVPDVSDFRLALVAAYEELCAAWAVPLDRDALASRTWR